MIKSRAKGSILLELVVATFLLGVVGVAIFLALVYGGNVSRRSQHYSQASHLANQEMEILRSMTYAAITTPYNGAFLGTTDTASAQLPSGTSNLTTSWYNGPTNTVKKVVVTVSWLEHSKATAVTYTTLLVDQGINQ